MQHNDNKKNNNAYKTLNRSRFLIFAFDTHVLQKKKNNEQELQELEELKELFITIYRLRYKRRRDALLSASRSLSHCLSVRPFVFLSHCR